jgi:tubulin polyglutamylase TTLL6/13
VLEEDRKRIRDRLLQRIKDSKDNNNNSSANKDDNDDSESEIYLDKQNNWAQQVAWEDTHLGGYRRILPCPNDRNRYQKFYVQQNQLSVYSETAASKRREECAKQQRIELEEKFKHNQAILKHFRFSKNLGEGGEEYTRKRKLKKNKRNYFKADEIVEHDERERLASMAQREYLVKSVGLLQSVYVNFHRGTLLTDSDRRKYKDLFAKTIANEASTSLPILGAMGTIMQSKPKFIKGPATITMPTNLSTLMENEPASSSNNNNVSNNNHHHHNNNNNSSSNMNNQSVQHLPQDGINNSSSLSVSNWISCSDVPVTFRPQLPCLAPNKLNITNNTNKAQLARQVTNVIKRHNIEARQQHADKVI